MLKLIKYEFRKQGFTKLVLLVLALLLEAVFFFGLFAGKDSYMYAGLSLLTMLATAGIFFVAFESVWAFSKDLRTKTSYMLFMTPNTSYTIVGAKVISSGIQVMLTGLAFGGFLLIDGIALLAKDDKLNELKEGIQELFNLASDGQLVMNLFWIAMMLLLFWIFTMILGFLSITLSATFLANNKLKGIISFIIFIALSYVFSIAADLIGLNVGTLDYNDNGMIMLSNIKMMTNCVYTIVWTVAAYIGTAYMLDKKVNL